MVRCLHGNGQEHEASHRAIRQVHDERFDVKEYWVVDPELDTIKVYRRDAGLFARAAELTAEAGDILTTPLLPELSVSWVDLFAMPL